MAIETLSEDFNIEMNEMMKQKEKTVGCRIKIENGLVNITIPKRKLKIINDDPIIQDKEITVDEQILTFSKREIKDLLQSIYVD